MNLQTIVAEATALEINDNNDLVKATEILSRVNKTIDNLETERQKVTKPLNEALRIENARFQPYIKQGKELVGLIKARMSAFRTLELAKQDKLADRVARGTMKPETAVRKMSEIKDIAISPSGAIKFRKKQQVKVTSLKDIPLEYFTLNESKLLIALKLGVDIKGAEIETIEIPINTR